VCIDDSTGALDLARGAMSLHAKRRFFITGHVFDTDIEHEIELLSDDQYALAYLEGFLEALYPSKMCGFDVGAPDLIGDVLEYEVHVYRR